MHKITAIISWNLWACNVQNMLILYTYILKPFPKWIQVQWGQRWRNVSLSVSAVFAWEALSIHLMHVYSFYKLPKTIKYNHNSFISLQKSYVWTIAGLPNMKPIFVVKICPMVLMEKKASPNSIINTYKPPWIPSLFMMQLA